MFKTVHFSRLRRRRKPRTGKTKPSGSTTRGKGVTTLTSGNARTPNAPEYMYARVVEAQSLLSGAQSVMAAKSPLKLDNWKYYLRNHPDQRYVQKMIDYIKYGVSIGYKGPACSRICPNWPSTTQLSDHVSKTLIYDVSRGTKAGPYPVPPFEHFIGSPLGAFMRKRSNKVRVIHDLSYPSHISVNSYIDEKLCSLQYSGIDDAVKHVLCYGPGALMMKLDLKNAFKHVVVAPKDWHLLGLTWPSPTGQTEYYVDLTLPFGLRSSPYIFDQFAIGLQYIMESMGCTNVEHYLDDFFSCGPPNDNTCQNNLDIMQEACEKTGFEVNPEKVSKPSTELEYLGIVIDSQNMILKISDDRLQETLDELDKWNTRKSCTKRELLSLIGKLSFICRVVKSGRTFIRRMIDSSKTVKYLHFRIPLNQSFRADLEWWRSFLPCWNGISAIHREVDTELYTDSSDTGIGCIYMGQWFKDLFTGASYHLRSKSIAWRELFAIIKAVATWCRFLANKKVLLYCDNESVTYIVNSGTSRDPEIMKLMRTLFFICASHNIEFKCQHIPGKLNIGSDHLSRDRIDHFFRHYPSANPYMTLPAKILYDGQFI